VSLGNGLLGGICALPHKQMGHLKNAGQARETRTTSGTAVMATILTRLCAVTDRIEDSRVRVRPDRGSVNRSGTLMERLVAEIGIERATPHDLRRTALTMITRLGFGRDAMDRIANHKTNSVRSRGRKLATWSP
jgi:integrase